jgi:uncharacterized membrane protein YfcA
MYFPIADVTVNPILLMGVGFLVGILGGFFCVGGGFLAGPMMFWTGVPMNFVVGTDLAHMTGKSIVAARRHRALGHVDFKLGAFMVLGTIIGVEIGARLIEALKAAGNLDLTIGVTYIVILVGISIFTAWESIRAIQMVRTDQINVEQAVGFSGLAKRIQGLNLPPLVSFPVSGIESVSVWMVLGVGLITGVLAGSLGWRWFHPHAAAGLCPGCSHPCCSGHRPVRDRIFIWIRHHNSRAQGQCGYPDCPGDAGRRRHWRTDRCHSHQVLLWPPHPPGFFGPAAHRRGIGDRSPAGSRSGALRRK